MSIGEILDRRRQNREEHGADRDHRVTGFLASTDRHMSLGYLLNATFLISDPELLILIFACLLHGSNLVILGGACDDE